VSPSRGQAEAVRTRILEKTYDTVARQGMGATSIEDVAREAGVSRATIYRYFPGGRDEVFEAVVQWETERFFARLAEEIAGAPDVESLLVEALYCGRKAIEEHAVLQNVLEAEPGLLVPKLTAGTMDVLEVLRAFLVSRLSDHLAEGVDAEAAGDYVGRMLLSFIASPGRWDLSDREQVRTLVRSELIAGLVS
jgi:AcrR family transcriptional regulator